MIEQWQKFVVPVLNEEGSIAKVIEDLHSVDKAEVIPIIVDKRFSGVRLILLNVKL